MPEAIHAYFAELFQLKDGALDKKNILAAERDGIDGCLLPFAQIAERFHLIEAPTRTVYLPIEEGAVLCSRLRAGAMSRALLRKLGAYSVDCYEPQFRALDDAGALVLLPDGAAVLTDLSKYDGENRTGNECGIGNWRFYLMQRRDLHVGAFACCLENNEERRWLPCPC